MKRRSPHAQVEAMKENWPGFVRVPRATGLEWIGRLQPKSQEYVVRVIWDATWYDRPYVVLLQPQLQPRPGCDWAAIPHLLFCDDAPERSGLCLFDPDGAEWTQAELIAQTTIPWVSEWLVYYELWHLTGEWLAPSVGAESVAALRAPTLERA